MRVFKKSKTHRIIKAFPRFLVIGAGHGGLAMAGHLALKGFKVNLYNRNRNRIKLIRSRGGIEVYGQFHGFGRLRKVSNDIGEVIDNVDVIMVVVPATAHKDIVQVCGPYLRKNQIVVLNPGRTGGALEFYNTLKKIGIKEKITIVETQTFLYASRNIGPGEVKIFRMKNVVPLAALPATKTKKVLRVLNLAYPQFIPAKNVLKTSLDNMGAIFHPALTILNGGWIEATQGDFDYYTEGVTPSVSKIMEKLDEERIEVARALKLKPMSAKEWVKIAYNVKGETFYEVIRNNIGYKGIKAPSHLDHRYIFEDVPASLVPIASIGEYMGIKTPTINTFIHLASIIHDTDYWKIGRSIETLGLKGKTLDEIYRLVTVGE